MGILTRYRDTEEVPNEYKTDQSFCKINDNTAIHKGRKDAYMSPGYGGCRNKSITQVCSSGPTNKKQVENGDFELGRSSGIVPTGGEVNPWIVF